MHGGAKMEVQQMGVQCIEVQRAKVQRAGMQCVEVQWMEVQ